MLRLASLSALHRATYALLFVLGGMLVSPYGCWRDYKAGGGWDRHTGLGDIFAMIVFVGSSEAFAQCTREGEELCQSGQTYRCEKTGSELTPTSRTSLAW